MTIQNMYRLLRALAICLLLAGCANNENKELLECLSDIQAMGDSCPQKAMLRLDSIRPLFENESEYMRNKFALLDIRLRDKAYITHTSDSTIKQVCGYFEKHGSDREKQEAYYYMGSVYRDMNDYPRAVTSYLKSVEIAEKSEDADPAILEVACMQLSALYGKQFNYKEALSISLKGLDVAEKYNIANERTYIEVANSYLKSRIDTAAAKKLYVRVFDTIKDSADDKNADILAYLMGVFSKLGNKQIADSCFLLLQQLPKNNMPHNYLINLANYQEKFFSADSAINTRLELFDSAVNGTESIYNASRWLTRYYAGKREYERATRYAISFIEANEKIIKDRDLEKTANAKNLYQYHRDREEEQRIMLESEQKSKMLIIIIASTFIIILFITTLYFRYRRRMLARLVSMNVRVAELGNEILRKEKEISEMGEKVDELDRQKDLMERKIREQKLKNDDLVKLLMTKDSRDDDSGIVDCFKSAATGKCSVGDSEWDRLYDYVSSKYPDFAHELQCESVRINSTTLRLYCMLKIGLTNREIENITGWPHQTVWYRVKRIEKVFNGNVIG